MSDDKKIKVVGPTATWDEELRKWLEGYVKKYPHQNTKVLSRKEYIGVSRTALDQYLAATYFQKADPKRSQIEHRIRVFRDRIEGTVRHGYNGHFVETQTWHWLNIALDTAIDEHAIVVVFGKSGVGKTRGMIEYIKNKLTTAPIEVTCWRNISTRYFGQKVARQLGMDDAPPIARLEDMISQKLHKSPRPIIVDQANYLDEKGLGSLCYWWEQARVPIVLIGTRDLYEVFVSSRLTEDVREQLARRITMFYELPALTHQEGYAVIKKALGGSLATDAVCALLLSETGGVFGSVANALKEIKKLQKQNARLGIEQMVRLACSKVMTVTGE